MRIVNIVDGGGHYVVKSVVPNPGARYVARTDAQLRGYGTKARSASSITNKQIDEQTRKSVVDSLRLKR